ncbi:phosphatidylserine decarboxylase-related [Chloroherpeton thalassium ATCC 35110]|uniref:Phosphatidylserine decarboxylase-related n=1 Tax=Chloroherpeton thalassium (strain ATCC 35110 / GB-78) TaxID=517418 RepID=B3QZB6_CHLT3|nr:phosphatidylserine decarboxylase [Chloroherpeton thalassium]ACF13809.1 phosphatidylserine decarboxylase-related [Chloroherpeton thalassium ATCC 35110]
MNNQNAVSQLSVESQSPKGCAGIGSDVFYAKFQLGQTFLQALHKEPLAENDGRGLNVVQYDPVTLQPVDGVQSFDTYGNKATESAKFKAYVDSIPDDAIVAIAVCDSAVTSGGSLSNDVIAACQSLGSTNIENVAYRVPWAMVAQKGSSKLAEKIGIHSQTERQVLKIYASCVAETSDSVISSLENEAPYLTVSYDGKEVTLEEALTESVQAAQKSAAQSLDADLYKGLAKVNGLPVGWPLSFEDYIVYLQQFAEYIPKQSDDAAWVKPGTEEYQEIYDRLCHFYFLVNQTDTPIQNNAWFSKWLVKYANAWGSFLNTTASFSAETLQSFRDRAPEYRVEDSMIDGRPNNPSGWLTFNQFFARELNPGLRPIASPSDNTAVTSPADCTYRNHFQIDENSKVVIKGTHTYSVEQLLKGSKYQDTFAGGVFFHCFLGPYSYHRFHTPVSGKIEECYAINEKVYLEVNIDDKGQFDAPDSSAGGYEFSQARGVITIDTKDSPYGDVGVVAIIPIGMAQVSSVNMTAVAGNETLKGDEFGYFLFGGSDIIMLFEKKVNAQVVPAIMQESSSSNELPYLHYGEKVVELTV